MNEEEKRLIGLALACYIEDTEKRLKKEKGDTTAAFKQLERVKYITYTKIIPNSWCGPRPDSWASYENL